jgi:hypothetical protein
MTIVITASERSPDGGTGLARDPRVRWPLAPCSRQAGSSSTSPGDMPACSRPMRCLGDRIRDRLVQLSGRLGDADWLDGDFSACDLYLQIAPTYER